MFGLPRLVSAYCHGALFVLYLPLAVQELWGPQDKGWYLGLFSGGAAAASMLTVWLAGVYADAERQAAWRVARLRGQVGLGLLALAGLGGLAGLGLGPWPLAWLLAAVLPARTLADTASLALLAEHPGLRPWERYSSAVSLCHFLGSALGAALFGLAPLLLSGGVGPSRQLAALLAPALALAAWLGWRQALAGPLQSEAAPDPPARGLNRELALFIASRLFFQAGMFMVPTFLLYMVQDLMRPANAQITTAWLMGLTLLGAALFAWPAQRVTRRLGEVAALLGAGLLLALVVTAFVLGAGGWPLVAHASMALYGAASGLVMSAGISLNLRLLPPGAGSGRIMGLVSSSTFLSQFMASLGGGAVLHHLDRHYPGSGYHGLLVLFLAMLALGALFLLLMHRQARPAGYSPDQGQIH